MKRRILLLFLLAGALPALSACRKGYDYTRHISEARSDIFRAETVEFTLTLDCVSREYPYLTDGIACPMTKLVEISLVPVSVRPYAYEVYLGDSLGGEMSFRSARGDWFWSASVEAFPENTVSLRVVCEDGEREIAATSVKNENTLTAEEALNFAVRSESEYIGRMTSGGEFRGEFYVRLLRRDRTYYYVGIADGSSTLSLLLDSETGEVLARRENRS